MSLEQAKVFGAVTFFMTFILHVVIPDPIFTALPWMVYFIIHTFIYTTGLNAESKP